MQIDFGEVHASWAVGTFWSDEESLEFRGAIIGKRTGLW
jgi:hypothetical protein